MRPGPALHRPFVVAATMLAPILGGAFIYYSVRKTHPKTADFANAVSGLGFLAWGYTVWAWQPEGGRLVLGLLSALGLIATDISIRLIRHAPPEIEPTADVAPADEELKPRTSSGTLVE
jgi:hypothetical protein